MKTEPIIYILEAPLESSFSRYFIIICPKAAFINLHPMKMNPPNNAIGNAIAVATAFPPPVKIAKAVHMAPAEV